MNDNIRRLLLREWRAHGNAADMNVWVGGHSAGLTAKEVTLFWKCSLVEIKTTVEVSRVLRTKSNSLSSISAKSGVLVAPVTQSTQAELAQHRLQERLESEVVADFFCLSSTGGKSRQTT